MKVRKRDWLTMVLVAAALTVFIVSTGREKSRPIPFDDKHRPFYESMQKQINRIEAERKCATCHSPQAIPLPEKHPPKEQCLICHKLEKTKQ